MKLERTYHGSLHALWARLSIQACDFCAFLQRILISHYGRRHIESKLSQGYTQKLFLYREYLDLSAKRFHTIEDDVAWMDLERPHYLSLICSAPKSLYGIPAATFLREERTRNDEESRDWVSPAMFVVRPDSENMDQSVRRYSLGQPGRLVDPKEIDWKLIKSWESACPHGAGDALATSRVANRPRIRFIDVEKLCVVECP